MEAALHAEAALRAGAAEPGSLRPLAWILAGGLCVRLLLWYAWGDLPVHVVDAQDYYGLAQRLLETGAYVSESGEPTCLRPPLYPAMLAGILATFGADHVAAVRLVQALLGLLTVVIVYALGREVYGHRSGIAAAAMTCFYPSFLGFHNLLLSETLFTLLAALVTLLAAKALRRHSWGALCMMGLVLGLGALTRSILWLFAFPLIVYLATCWKGSWRRKTLAAIAPMSLFLLTIAPWAARNTRLEGTLTVIDCMGGRNAMMGNYEHTPLERSWATIDLATGEKAWHRVLASKYPEFDRATQGQKDKLAMRYGKEFVLAHPLLTAKRDLIRFFNFWQLERTLIAGASRGYFGPMPRSVILLLGLLICGSYILAIWSGILGAWFVPPPERRTHWLLLGSILFPCVIHTLIFAHSRYHIPVMPLVFLYSAAVLANPRAAWQQRQSWRLHAGIACCALLALGWMRELIVVDLKHFSSLGGG